MNELGRNAAQIKRNGFSRLRRSDASEQKCDVCASAMTYLGYLPETLSQPLRCVFRC